MENFLGLFCFFVPFAMVVLIGSIVFMRWLRREIVFGKKTVNDSYWGSYKTAPNRVEANLFYLPKQRKTSDIWSDNAPHTMH